MEICEIELDLLRVEVELMYDIAHSSAVSLYIPAGVGIQKGNRTWVPNTEMRWKTSIVYSHLVPNVEVRRFRFK